MQSWAFFITISGNIIHYFSF